MEVSQEELEALVRRHAPAVYRLAYARTGSRADAEDIMQETFLRFLRRAPVLRDEDHCRAWLLHTASNCAKNLFRRPKPLPLEEETAQVPAPEPGGVLEAVLALPEKYAPLCACTTARGTALRRSPEFWGKKSPQCAPGCFGPGPC